MHCDEDLLIAYLDGELPIVSRLTVRMHLRRCGKCRARVTACEQTIVSIAEAMDQWGFPASGWKQQAKSCLNERMHDAEVELAKRSEARPMPRLGWLVPVLTATLLLFSVPFARKSKSPSMNPAEAIARAASAETLLFRPAVKEEIAVVVEEVKPRRLMRRSRMEAISDPATGRYSAKVRSENGDLKEALWKPDNRSEFVFQADVSKAIAQRRNSVHQDQLLSDVADAGLESEQLEASFMRWLERRSWRPVSLTEDLALLARQNGTLLQMEKSIDSSGSAIIRVTARRNTGRQIVAVLTLDLDASTFRPRLQRIRFEDKDREIELCLSVTDIREIPRATLSNASFRPPDLPAVPRQSVLESSSRASDSLLKTEDVPVVPRYEDLNGTVQALYALHQAAACTGISVEISESPLGIVVRERSSNGAEPRRFLATKATIGEALTALAEVRDSLGTHALGAGAEFSSTEDMKRHLAALRLMTRLFSPGLPALTDISKELLRTMFRDHSVLLSQDLEDLAALTSQDFSVPENVDGVPEGRLSFSERLRLLEADVEQADRQSSKAHLKELRVQVDRLDAEYRERVVPARYTGPLR